VSDYKEQTARPSTGLIGTPGIGVRQASAADLSGGADGNMAMPQFSSNGAKRVTGGHASVFKNLAAVSVTAGTPVAAWTPTASKKFRVLGFMLSLSVAGAVILKDATTEKLRTPLMAAGVGLASPQMGDGILSALADNVLNIDVTATGTVSGFIFGIEE